MPENERRHRELSDEEKIQKRIKETIEPAFSEGAKLFHDVLNFWVDTNTDYLKHLSPDQLKNHFDSLEPLSHYQEGYLNKGEIDAKTALEYGDEESSKFIKASYPKETKKIMELSDSEQITKYDQLIDEFNAELPRIKQEQDLKTLGSFYQRAISLINERNKKI